jgi:hypothetical protein
MGVISEATIRTLVHRWLGIVHRGTITGVMSALDQKRTLGQVLAMSALPPKADIHRRDSDIARSCTANPTSIPIRRSEREERTEWPGLLYRSGKRRASEQARAVGTQ